MKLAIETSFLFVTFTLAVLDGSSAWWIPSILGGIAFLYWLGGHDSDDFDTKKMQEIVLRFFLHASVVCGVQLYHLYSEEPPTCKET